ncbi:hypothetical protein [Labilibacter marinus]|uniref:hypothetical protein n=1 Tax=Labilibacter marinus TaxID=1477105 RepID=UPI000834A884|nr:hypothetical protein [Labilibacter marinus]
MKKFLILILLIITTLTISAQAPDAFNYQAVVRDNSGNIITNQDVKFQINILQGAVDGTAIYSETHTVQTNGQGLVNMVIGTGTSTDDISTINWGSDSYYIQINLDINGGENYELMGTSQLLSVPYALNAKTADNLINPIWMSNNGQSSNQDYKINIGLTTPSNLHYFKLNLVGNLVPNTETYDMIGFYKPEFNKPSWHISLVSNDIVFAETGQSGSRLYLKEGGNVGIGTNKPARLLHVSDAMRLEPLPTPPSNPNKGDLYFGEDGKLHLYNGQAWYSLNMTLD